jgi:DnaJ-class molecular chaperone
MVGKDYYLIQGVARSASAAGIRAWYRDLARRLHPDVAGARSTSAFQAITEAYQVLADPAARRRYNEELAQGERVPAAEPVTPSGWIPMSRQAEPYAVRPSFDALMERLVRSFTGLGIPKSERPEGLTFEVILTPDEAVRGVHVPIGIPRVHSCPMCGGTGRVWLFPCRSCREQGVVQTEEVLRVPIPPLVRPGSMIEVPLHGLGIHNLYLRLHVRIE